MSFGFSLGFLSAVLAGAIAFVTLVNAKRSLARWAFALGMMALAVESLCSALTTDALLPDQVVYWQTFAFGAMAFLPLAWLLFSLTYGRGNYPEFLRKWRYWLWAMFLLPQACYWVFRNELLFAVAAPEGKWIFRVGTPGVGLNVLLVIACVLVLMNLEATFRAAVGTMRWRIKFMVLGLAVLFAVRSYTCTQLLLFRTMTLARNDFNSAALIVGCLLILRSLVRAGHFEIGVYPSQSILHNSITLVIAGAYLVVIGVLAKIVSLAGGDASFELKAFVALIALVLLALAFLSDHVRLYAKQFASRHFHRPMYDYRTVWRLFTEGTTRRVEEADLCASVVRLMSDIFQALSVTIWVLDEKKQRLALGASTSLSQNEAGGLQLTGEQVSSVVEALTASKQPVDIDSSNDDWAIALGQSHPTEFARGGNRICVPMLAGGELMGVLVLGDRVAGVPFSLQDFELLKCAGNQAAAGLLNIALAQRLSQSKQLEAFQAMSAFFVHDLKNTASTLSLMLQNLPLHYNDPAFREDALRGISKTVKHIDHLVTRLTVLRHDLSLQLVECDLNQLVAETLKQFEQAPGIDLESDLRAIPRIALDPMQIQKVLTNLLLNAREALPTGGRICVETNRRNGWVVLAVADNGCGMSSEFVQRSLFRPFKTTKAKGIGIGMFHCKMIVEAHHGRIEVDSKLGSGTTFRVFLPFASKEPSKL